MVRKKSMRIFLFTLCLLVFSGALIIGIVQLKEHEKEAEDRQALQKTQDSQTDADTDLSEAASVMRPVPYARESSPRPDVAQGEYCYEIRITGGYLDVYYYGTDRLFMHTGIAESLLSEAQMEALGNGKYFKNEQELYGYLESCTS